MAIGGPPDPIVPDQTPGAVSVISKSDTTEPLTTVPLKLAPTVSGSRAAAAR